MAHVRTQIRDRAVTTLTGLTTTGASVFKSRVLPMDASAMPGICVYCKAEKGVEENFDILFKEVEVVVDAYVAGSSFDTTTDLIAAEVETALYADVTADDRYLNGIALSLEYQQSDSQYNGDGEKPYGVLRMIYRAKYAINRGAPETHL